jgi:predicted nuclease of predicted toxin-antitoxin system
MKLLFDQNISHRILNLISEVYPKANQVRGLKIENFSDKSIWEFAKKGGYTIVTFDSDFYNFSLVWGFPPKIIWLKTKNQTTKNVSNLILKHQETIQHFIENENLSCLEIIS